MRVIDADMLIEYIAPGKFRSLSEVCYSENDLVDIIKVQPTVCDIDGIIADRDYWKAEAQKTAAKLGEIGILLKAIHPRNMR